MKAEKMGSLVVLRAPAKEVMLMVVVMLLFMELIRDWGIMMLMGSRWIFCRRIRKIWMLLLRVLVMERRNRSRNCSSRPLPQPLRTKIRSNLWLIT